MPKQQLNVRISKSGARKLAWLAERHGSQTAAIEAAIDRLHHQEAHMDERRVYDLITTSRYQIEDDIVEYVMADVSSEEVLASHNGDVAAAADDVVSAWAELYPDQIPVDHNGDPIDVLYYASCYFERLAERLAAEAAE